MKPVRFKCTLLSDIILSEKAATEGSQRTLDYIPGNVFLGIVAGKIYGGMNPEESMQLFHSGKVRFGDAHPLINETRAIRIPASWYLNKGENLEKGKIFLFPVDNEVPKTQCRSEFIFKIDDAHFDQIKPETNFAIKSAYDKELRRSKDEQMYGYQSLEAGMVFCFEVEFEDTISDELVQQVTQCLVGKRTIGRSKTAQYGQVYISIKKEGEPDEDINFNIDFAEDHDIKSGYTYLYAESRLLFLDDNGQPVIPMDGSYYKMEGATVDLGKSQIRSFRYAPYNFKRQSRDADRFGIEKGSVICLDRTIKGNEKAEIKKGIGLYLNEGFGKVLVNPEFLKSKETAEYGEALFAHIPTNDQKVDKQTKRKSGEIEIPETLKEKTVLLYLKKSLEKEEEQTLIFNKVDEFISTHVNLFTSDGNTFSSQWGTIRTKALQSTTLSELQDALFKKAKEEAQKIKEGYLVRGQSSSKWEGKRIRVLEKFVSDLQGLDPKVALKTVVNLSSEMAKLCQKKGGKQ